MDATFLEVFPCQQSFSLQLMGVSLLGLVATCGILGILMIASYMEMKAHAPPNIGLNVILNMWDAFHLLLVAISTHLPRLICITTGQGWVSMLHVRFLDGFLTAFHRTNIVFRVRRAQNLYLNSALDRGHQDASVEHTHVYRGSRSTKLSLC